MSVRKYVPGPNRSVPPLDMRRLRVAKEYEYVPPEYVHVPLSGDAIAASKSATGVRGRSTGCVIGVVAPVTCADPVVDVVRPGPGTASPRTRALPWIVRSPLLATEPESPA